LVKKR
jgi:hypothetical protein